METFDFPYHSMRVKYPEGQVMHFGRGYSFGTKPLLPVARTFILHFNTMRWFLDTDGITPISSTEPQVNLLKLLEFYDTHQMWKRFVYPSQLYGNTTVRFGTPFETPYVVGSGQGWSKDFEIQLVEQPQ